MLRMVAALGLATALACVAHAAAAQTSAPVAESRTEIQAALPTAQPAGSGRLRVWGFEVYDASLWVAPGFRQGSFAEHAFALELNYLRGFTAQEIAKRSLHEMSRFASITPEQAAAWQTALAASFPDVKRGDRLAGVNKPGVGIVFLSNGKPTGEIRNVEFARLFFSIWLAQGTSEPALRQALLAGTLP